MKFVSRYAHFGFNVYGGSFRWTRDSSGNERQTTDVPHFYAQFKTGGLDIDEQAAAIEQFTAINPEHPFGAHPKMTEDVINAQEAMMEGEAHNGHEAFLPYQRLGVFDTANPSQCPPALREDAEAALLGAGEFGVDLVRIDNYNLVPPWPSYPTAANANAEKLVAFAKQGGMEFAQVLRYELATLARPSLVKAFAEAEAEQSRERAEARELAVQ